MLLKPFFNLYCTGMETLNFSLENFPTLLQQLASSEVIILPTDTSYGFSASPFSASAVEQIQTLKKRPADKPFLLLVADFAMAEEYGAFSPMLTKFAGESWRENMPPRTLLVPRKDNLPSFFPEFSELGFRVPQYPLLREFLALWGKPLISTSANISGNTPIFSAEEIERQFSDSKLSFASAGNLPPASPSEIWRETAAGLKRLR